MPIYTIEIENLDPNCSNNKTTQQIVANTCSEYIVRVDPTATTKGPFNIYVNTILVLSNVSRTQMVIGQFINLNCEDTPTYLLYASSYNLFNNLDTIFYEDTGLNRRWGAGNGLAPEYSNVQWQNFIERRITNNDRIINLTELSGITNPTNVGQQIKLNFPIGSGNTSALLIYPSKYGYISDNGLQEIGNTANVQGLKPKSDDRQIITLSGESYYVAQITEYQGSEGQSQNWQVISNES